MNVSEWPPVSGGHTPKVLLPHSYFCNPNFICRKMSVVKVVAAADMYPAATSTEVKKTLAVGDVWRAAVEVIDGVR
jgi:hypothetical protein